MTLQKVPRRALFAVFFAPPQQPQVDLFRQGDGGVHTFRIPALIQTKNGTLLAVADARHDNKGDLPGRISLVMRTSRDLGKTWTRVRTIRAVSEGGVGDASLLLDEKTGRVWCFFAYGPPGIGFRTAKPGERTGLQTLQVHAMFSDDDGGTWSEPIDLTPQIKRPEWQAIFATSGTHFQTSRGRYLVPLVVRDEHAHVTARNAYSDDGGKTWHVGEAVAPDTDESHAVEIAGGVILQNSRSETRKLRVVARSEDGGVTFRDAHFDESLVDARCNAGLARRVRGPDDLLIFTNAASLKRENLTLKLSRDGGRTWDGGRVIQAGPAAYSTVIPLRDGSLGVLYERGVQHEVETITFTRVVL